MSITCCQRSPGNCLLGRPGWLWTCDPSPTSADLMETCIWAGVLAFVYEHSLCTGLSMRWCSQILIQRVSELQVSPVIQEYSEIFIKVLQVILNNGPEPGYSNFGRLSSPPFSNSSNLSVFSLLIRLCGIYRTFPWSSTKLQLLCLGFYFAKDLVDDTSSIYTWEMRG